MTIAEKVYRIIYRKRFRETGEIPYYWQYSVSTIIAKPIRKFFSAVLIPNIPFNGLRVLSYRMCGYKIGKSVFIGMKCYLDDMCYDKIVIEDNVTISYGVYFACHGRKQGHNAIVIKQGAYIGMRASIIARHDIEIGEDSIIGACTLVNKSVPASFISVGVPNKNTPPYFIIINCISDNCFDVGLCA